MTAAAAGTSESPKSLAKKVSVSVNSVNNVVQLAVTASSPRQSLDLAKRLVDSYVKITASRSSRQYTAQADALKSTIESIQGQLSSGASAGNTQPLEGALSNLVQQQAQLVAAAAVNSGPATILTAPSEPLSPNSLSVPRAAAIGAGVGTALAVSLLLVLTISHRESNTSAHEPTSTELLRASDS